MSVNVMSHRKTPLINPTWDEIVANDPLVAFSWYLSGRKNVLLDVADEILAKLDAGFHGSHVDMKHVERAESLMWLWILAAYEVIRTMHQAKDCFAARVQRALADLKRSLATVRIPTSKMEKRGKQSEPVTSNRSPSGFDPAKKDLLLGDPEATMLSARALIAEFKRFVDSLVPADVLHRHEDRYHTKA